MIISSTSGHACEDTQHMYPYMHDGHLLRLKFSQNVYELKTMTDGHGTLQATHTSGLPGDSVTLTPVPDPMYTFTGYQSTGCTINGNTLTFGAQDCTAKANFYKPPEKVFVSKLSGYTTLIQPAPSANYTFSAEYKITGDDGRPVYIWPRPSNSGFGNQIASISLTAAQEYDVKMGFTYGSYLGTTADAIRTNPDLFLYDTTSGDQSDGYRYHMIVPNTLHMKPNSACLDLVTSPQANQACLRMSANSYFTYTATCGEKSVTGNMSQGTLFITSALDPTNLSGNPIINVHVKAKDRSMTLNISAGTTWSGSLYRME